MKYTNKWNLPPAMVEALKYDDYSCGQSNFTPSSLNAPVYQKKLLDLYDDQIEIDVVENFHLMMGKAVHKVLETTEARAHKELRVYSQVGKWLISMQMDNFWMEEGIMQDYKNTTVYKFTMDWNGNLPAVPEWEAQLNIGRYILTHNPMIEVDGKLVPFEAPQVKGLQIIGLLKDWSKAKARRDRNFPQTPIYPRDIQFWPDQMVETYIYSRASLHDAAKNKDISELTPCSEEETWAKPTVYAVMVKGAKKSKKNCVTREEAEREVRKYPGGYVEIRPGSRPRCEDYCYVSKFCPFFTNFQKKINNGYHNS